MERVRAPLARLGRPLREAEVLGTASASTSIAQVPHVAGQRWVGLAAGGDGAPVDGAASLVLQDAPARLQPASCAGCSSTSGPSWCRAAPRPPASRSSTTRPTAAAPQAILLAVPPVIGEPWTVGGLNRVLLETLDLLRIRAVDPAALGDVAHYLPATYLAFNAERATPSPPTSTRCAP